MPTPDGYTMMLASVGTHAQSQTLYKKPLYNSATDFTPVAFLAETPIALITRKDLPVKTSRNSSPMRRPMPGQDDSIGSAGAGSATHLGCVVLDTAMGTKITHVPYRGTGPAMQDLQGGRIDFLCDIIATAKPQIDGGTVKGLAIMTKDRSPVLPNLPTTGRARPRRAGLYLERAVPAERRAARRGQEAERSRGRRDQYALGAGADEEPGRDRRQDRPDSPEWLGKFIESEIKKWEAPIKASGVSAD